SSKITVLRDREATPEGVLDALRTCTNAHFACHGKQTGDPSMSALKLAGGQPLTLRKLMATRRSGAHRELAVLSACETATGDADVPDEGIHLAAGMLALGFRGVIGTMWGVHDVDAPKVMKVFYERVVDPETGSPDASRAAWALHEAVQDWRMTMSDPYEASSVLRWSTFIHMGV
ncbi:CHAT domain-containing protein, partial [Vararia minispora EC-137]